MCLDHGFQFLRSSVTGIDSLLSNSSGWVTYAEELYFALQWFVVVHPLCGRRRGWQILFIKRRKLLDRRVVAYGMLVTCREDDNSAWGPIICPTFPFNSTGRRRGALPFLRGHQKTDWMWGMKFSCVSESSQWMGLIKAFRHSSSSPHDVKESQSFVSGSIFDSLTHSHPPPALQFFIIGWLRCHWQSVINSMVSS